MKEDKPLVPEIDLNYSSHEESEEKKLARVPYRFSDIVTGLNRRNSDNIFQLVFIFISVVICSVAAVIYKRFFIDSDYEFAVLGNTIFWFAAGALVGLIAGLFISGFLIGVFRALKIKTPYCNTGNMSDTITGINSRRVDNLFQLVFIAFAVLVCSGGSGLYFYLSRGYGELLRGIVLGALGGLLGGLLLSGLILGIYRLIKRD